MNEDTDKQPANSNKPWQFQPGQSGNPKGRPKGKTIKERVREYLEEHPEDMESFVRHFVKNNRDLAWQMLEGRPPQSIVGGEEDNPVIIKIIKEHGADTRNTDVP